MLFLCTSHQWRIKNNLIFNFKNNISCSGENEPRYLYIETLKTSNLGISLVGGNAVGIFIHSVQPDSLAHRAGLRTGDQILEYNGSDLRNATAEEAAYELAKPADKVTVLSHYRIESKSLILSFKVVLIVLFCRIQRN